MKTAETPILRHAGLRELLRHFGPEIRAQRRWIALSLFALMAEVGLRLLEPWPIKVVFDHVLGVGNSGAAAGSTWFSRLTPGALLTLAALAVVTCTGLRALAAYWNTVGCAIAGTRAMTAVRERLFRHLHRLPLSFYTRARCGDLVVRVISDVGLLQDVTVTAFLPLVARLMILAGMVGVMFWMHWQLALLGLALVPLFWLRTVKLSRDIREVARQQRRREGALAATAAESFSGMKIVQALAAAEAFTGVFASHNDRSLKQDVKGKRLAASLERSVDVLIAGATALVLWQGARLVRAGQLTPGELLVFLTYLKSAFRPVQDVAKFTGRFGKASAAGARVLELLEAAPEVVDSADAIEAPAFRGEIQFDQVSFEYEPGRPVLDQVSFTIRAGQTVAILGESGSGKSTLLNLVARLYAPTRGRILLDGRDLREYRVDSMRRQLGIVAQENLLFAGSVRDNLTLGLPAATAAQVDAAVRLANAQTFIAALPEGDETLVGERGATLSHGQRQRIAIARAAIRGASLLLFDEPTTGLDAANERAVLNGLRNLSRGRTTLWVTHDPRHAASSDVVLRVAGGRVTLEGGPGLAPEDVMEGSHAVLG